MIQFINVLLNSYRKYVILGFGYTQVACDEIRQLWELLKFSKVARAMV